MKKDLSSALDNETAGILNWALIGLQRLRNNDWNLTPNPKTKAMAEAHFQNSNPVTGFVYNCVMASAENRVQTSKVFNEFVKYAQNNGIRLAAFSNPRKFKELFLTACNNAGYDVTVVKNSTNHYKGISLNIPVEPCEREVLIDDEI